MLRASRQPSLRPERLRLADRSAGSRVLMRADAGAHIGMGHASRLHALACELVERGASITIVGDGIPASDVWDTLPGVVEPSVDRPPLVDTERSVAIQHADADRTLAVVEQPDVVIVDSYALGSAWQERARDRAPDARLVAIDDMEAREHQADLLVDPNLGQDGPGLGRAGHLLRGTAYAPLSAGYRSGPASTGEERTRRSLLVSLGGGRSAHLPVLARALAQEPRLRDVELVLVIPDPDDARAAEDAVADRKGVRLLGRLPDLRPVMEQADLVIGAGGTSAWERLRLGIPSVVVPLAQNQVRICRELDRHGLGVRIDDIADTGSLVEAVVQSLGDDVLRDRTRAIGPLLVDGSGTRRLGLALLPTDEDLVLREVHQDDLPALLAMANDPVTRSMSRSGALISPDRHLEWFARLTPVARRTFWVAELHGVVVGQVRFDARRDGWELSYALEPSVRGRGLSTGLLAGGIRLLRSHNPRPIVGVVSDANTASHRIFRRLGFTVDPDGARAQEFGAEVGPGFSAYLLDEHAPTP